jgi:hypothetical protein
MAQLDKGGFILRRYDGGDDIWKIAGWVYVQDLDFLTSVEHWVVVLDVSDPNSEIAWDSPGAQVDEEVRMYSDPSSGGFDAWMDGLRNRLRGGELRYIRCDCRANIA